MEIEFTTIEDGTEGEDQDVEDEHVSIDSGGPQSTINETSRPTRIQGKLVRIEVKTVQL